MNITRRNDVKRVCQQLVVGRLSFKGFCRPPPARPATTVAAQFGPHRPRSHPARLIRGPPALSRARARAMPSGSLAPSASVRAARGGRQAAARRRYGHAGRPAARTPRDPPAALRRLASRRSRRRPPKHARGPPNRRATPAEASAAPKTSSIAVGRGRPTP